MQIYNHFFLTTKFFSNFLFNNLLISFVRSIKPSAVTIKKSVTDIFDTAEITLPLNPYLTRDNTDGTVLPERDIIFNPGDKVKITMGYDDDNDESITS